ncbi:hypothetical protein Rhe02_09770 [Rhizocola hellebori]|uniref:DUF2786 domain-containing protein n=1 Tax=Rhizocola hellebori TaxID=1392758 RepID=A0A8J3Q302_9ACTN|nr:DUF2786 domain-containing protein [Rhizocola hellebori]GIH02910.1 hypothetical protein Rhe02_09770 [Rhizocola hellebori]
MSEQDITEPPAKMLSKVRALLAKAQDVAATKEEAEAFFAKATELIAKYGISRALLDAQQPTGPVAADRIFTVQGPYAERKAALLYHVGEALGGKGIRLGKGPGQTVRIHLFGIESDLERAELLFTSLLLQLHRFAALDFASDPHAYKSVRKWHGDYIRGFTATVVERIRRAEANAKAAASNHPSGPSVALVLVKRSDLVRRAFAEQYPKVRKGSAVRVGQGYLHGQAAGHRADLGGTSLPGTSQGALPNR